MPLVDIRIHEAKMPLNMDDLRQLYLEEGSK